MKKVLLITSFITLTAFKLLGQDKSSLVGEWEMHYNGSEKKYTLSKKVVDENRIGNWGHFIGFQEDGTYHESASAPCGLDDNRFNYSGKWRFNSTTKNIELSEITVINPRPNIYDIYNVLDKGTIKLLHIKNEVLTIEISKPWEKITKK